MCPPRFPAVVHPDKALHLSRASERREAAAAERAAAPRCLRAAAHFFLSVRSAGCWLWAFAASHPLRCWLRRRRGQRRVDEQKQRSPCPLSESGHLNQIILSSTSCFCFVFDTMESVEKECGALGGLFQAIVNDMKSSYPVWEDFSAKATKLHSQLRTTILAAVAFLDAFQKVADMATNSRGATRDVGSALTRMCMRHRSIEAKLRHFTNALMEGLVTPLQDRIEEWKKTANQLDKDHAKEYKRSRQEIKRKSLDTIKLQKKARKGRGNLRPQLDSAMQDVSDLYLLMEETEKQAVRRALLEERGRYCTFINLLQPVVNVEIAMLGEITHLQPIVDDLTMLTEDPHKLPPASEQVIRDLKGSDYSWSYQTPPSSPSSTGSRKSSMCSLLQMPSAGAHRLSSVSSHDSGFVSQDANTHSKPPSPMPSDIASQKSTSSASSEASETCQSVSECNSPTAFGSCSSFGTFRPAFSHTGTIRPLSVILPASPTFNHSPGSNTPSPTSKVPSWKDWAKSCEPSLASTLQRRRESVDKMRELEAPPSPLGYSGDDPHRARMGPGTIAAKHGEPLSPAASTLAMVLTRGLSMEQQKSSRDSLQYSSGYSTQTNTPSCSEDTIPSQGSDYECYSLNGDADSEGQADFDKSSTIPRHSNIAQSYRRMIQTKRPASTAGLPAGKTLQGTPNGAGGSSSGAITSGTATIRRTPSSKTGVRRTPSTSGPIPIRPPIVPVKTPTVPDSPGYASPSQHRAGSEEFLYGDDPAASDYMRASPKRMSLPDTAWGCGGGGGGPDRTVYAQQAPGMAAHSAEEDPLLAANRHSLVEKIGELAASAHALGEGHFPFHSPLPGDPAQCAPQEPSSTTQEDKDMLVSIRRGVRLRKAVTDDRSAPRILR
ncbi:MTSS I-BAR domain containing 2a isoform X2 [Plectropomus leopardus]|uniref:MTSS I-BAR domain containing 2a isoform X2 n=1 Tax=Plectropomus leopardus TaxID=160734 RepID=UPI001C4CC520|nr:MTSS I-BAR domain containing 2a isoform X2 [Plectropomus leopardus]